MLRARSCLLRSASRDRRWAGRAHHKRVRDARGARCGARGVRGRHGKSAFLCRGSRSARVPCRLSLLSSLRAALLSRSPPRGRPRTSGHATRARSKVEWAPRSTTWRGGPRAMMTTMAPCLRLPTAVSSAMTKTETVAMIVPAMMLLPPRQRSSAAHLMPAPQRRRQRSARPRRRTRRSSQNSTP